MVGEVVTGFSAFKSMLDIAKGLKDLNDAAARNAVAIELQKEVLAAHEAQAAMIERISSLEKRVADHETWEREKKRYQLTELPPGVFVYRVKEEACGTEPPHDICANCYEQRRKSILNKDEPINGQTALCCPSCGWEDKIGHYSSPNINRRPRGGSWMSN